MLWVIDSNINEYTFEENVSNFILDNSWIQKHKLMVEAVKEKVWSFSVFSLQALWKSKLGGNPSCV